MLYISERSPEIHVFLTAQCEATEAPKILDYWKDVRSLAVQLFGAGPVRTEPAEFFVVHGSENSHHFFWEFVKPSFAIRAGADVFLLAFYDRLESAREYRNRSTRAILCCNQSQ